MDVSVAVAAAPPASLLDQAQEFKISQTRKGCIQECFGCAANSEFQFLVNGQQAGMIFEQSSCCVRFFCGGNRWWDTKMTREGAIGDSEEQIASYPALYNFHRQYACQAGNCKCCCFQQVDVEDGAGKSLGMVKEQFYWCIPTFHTIAPGATEGEYMVHQPTCCGGACVNCCAQGCCNCRIPFHIYKPGAKEEEVLKSTGSSGVPGQEGTPNAQICKIWSGWKNEFLTDADTFELKAPDGSTSDAKARLIGMTLLLNQIFFEKSNSEN